MSMCPYCECSWCTCCRMTHVYMSHELHLHKSQTMSISPYSHNVVTKCIWCAYCRMTHVWMSHELYVWVTNNVYEFLLRVHLMHVLSYDPCINESWTMYIWVTNCVCEFPCECSWRAHCRVTHLWIRHIWVTNCESQCCRIYVRVYLICLFHVSISHQHHATQCDTPCNTLRHINTMQHTATHCVCQCLFHVSISCQHTAMHYNALTSFWHDAGYDSIFHINTPRHCTTLHHSATRCWCPRQFYVFFFPDQHIATRCNTLQDIARHCSGLGFSVQGSGFLIFGLEFNI